jgi:hypothetical protein
MALIFLLRFILLMLLGIFIALTSPVRFATGIAVILGEGRTHADCKMG